jgi:hypothetical protein
VKTIGIIAACVVAIAIVALVVMARATDDTEYKNWRDGR